MPFHPFFSFSTGWLIAWKARGKRSRALSRNPRQWDEKGGGGGGDARRVSGCFSCDYAVHLSAPFDSDPSSRPSIRLNASKNPFAGSGPCVDSIVIAFFFFFLQGRQKGKVESTNRYTEIEFSQRVLILIKKLMFRFNCCYLYINKIMYKTKGTIHTMNWNIRETCLSKIE